jgi:hypothetical protein
MDIWKKDLARLGCRFETYWTHPPFLLFKNDHPEHIDQAAPHVLDTARERPPRLSQVRILLGTALLKRITDREILSTLNQMVAGAR